MRIVVAVGGNALLLRGERPDADAQQRRVGIAATALKNLAAEHELVVTHGNGPQVGLLALESAADQSLARPYPFDVLTAQTEGMIGYWLVQALDGVVPDRHALAVITRTLVAADDPAFHSPSKFVGPVYAEDRARELGEAAGWRFGRDGDGWRRVVPSPAPVEICELADIEALLAAGRIVICAGGGGIAVAPTDGTRELRGVEAVIDKDRTAGLLADRLSADALLLLTDVDGVYQDFRTEHRRLIRRATAGELIKQDFPAGSMGPKITAACSFVQARPGAFAAIGSLADADAVLGGGSGTMITFS
ncbi:MAG: carbamate kinase [Microlunatus sp.]|nr:carbamate kinase [Microlunatus sp.]